MRTTVNDTADRLARLRTAMVARGIDAWLTTTADAHLSHYISDRWRTRAWLSGFRGTAGDLIVTRDAAGLWVDPRYHMRADSETAGTEITVFKLGKPGTQTLESWISEQVPRGGVLGFDPEAFSAAALEDLQSELEPAGVVVQPFKGVIDEAWTDRPAPSFAPVVEHPLEFAGETVASKLARVREAITARGATAMLVTGQDEVAWLLNLRGGDVPLNPVALAYAVVEMDGVGLFVDFNSVTSALRASLPREVALHPYSDIAEYVRQMPSSAALLVDPARTNVALYEAAGHTRLVRALSPIELLKAKKNETELRAAADAHVRCGTALTRLLHWLSVTDLDGETELSVAEKLEEFRHDEADYRGPSFPTIVGFGPNSAVGHYQLNHDNPQPLGRDAMLMIDTGCQFPGGTTDTTRTVILGRPTTAQVRTYTTVLKSLIMLSSAKFPAGTRGQQLDAIGRYHIWSNLWECRHGIGHGIGSYLHVHEGPQRINKTNDFVFEPGMMNSCEPGAYFEGDHGVRLENVIVTADAGESVFGRFNRFETLTLCPFDRELIDVRMLTAGEVEWLDTYHRRVFEVVGPRVGDDVREWLRGSTKGLAV